MYQECGHYYLCQLKLDWLDAISNSAIAFAYNLIPIIVVYSARKRQDLPFQWIYRLITTLVVIGGTIYLIEAWTFWRSENWLLGLLKAITAFGLLCAMILLVRLLPKVLTIPNLTELKQANHQLELEIKERHFAEEALRESKERF
ncbi:diguanylate cyclase, partial [Fischerella thermalis CCMEE 5319]